MVMKLPGTPMVMKAISAATAKSSNSCGYCWNSSTGSSAAGASPSNPVNPVGDAGVVDEAFHDSDAGLDCPSMVLSFHQSRHRLRNILLGHLDAFNTNKMASNSDTNPSNPSNFTRPSGQKSNEMATRRVSARKSIKNRLGGSKKGRGIGAGDRSGRNFNVGTTTTTTPRRRASPAISIKIEIVSGVVERRDADRRSDLPHSPPPPRSSYETRRRRFHRFPPTSGHVRHRPLIGPALFLSSCHRVLPIFTDFYRFLPSFTEFVFYGAILGYGHRWREITEFFLPRFFRAAEAAGADWLVTRSLPFDRVLPSFGWRAR